jgi:DNA-binding NarL/FixJ family response regulator
MIIAGASALALGSYSKWLATSSASLSTLLRHTSAAADKEVLHLLAEGCFNRAIARQTEQFGRVFGGRIIEPVQELRS